MRPHGYRGLTASAFSLPWRSAIDKSFIQDIEVDINDRTLVNTIIVMSHSLNLKVVAEGVETEAELEFLLEHEVDMIQGYLVSKPLPLGEFQEQLECYDTLSAEGYCLGLYADPGDCGTDKVISH